VIGLERDGEVFVLRVDEGENRFSPTAVAEWNRLLDEVEKAEGPKALVTTGSEKFYSNGLDLDFMMSEGADASDYLASVLALLGRVLTFPAVTVAAVNGHAFGAGAQLAVAHDFAIMRADRGYFCMPEVDMRVPLHPGMLALLKARLPVRTAHEVVATARRYGGEDALTWGIVDAAVEAEQVVPTAVGRARELAAKAHPAIRTIKRGLYPQVLAALEVPLDDAMRDWEA
jgi:enoyl-CoA hydratase/carnithine racemase